MSRYTAVSTDHSAEVTIIRTMLVRARRLIADLGYPEDGLDLQVRIRSEREAVILDAAADLLECHDATGITLDEWSGPKALVHAALELCGLEPGRLLHHAEHPERRLSPEGGPRDA